MKNQENKSYEIEGIRFNNDVLSALSRITERNEDCDKAKNVLAESMFIITSSRGDDIEHIDKTFFEIMHDLYFLIDALGKFKQTDTSNS